MFSVRLFRGMLGIFLVFSPESARKTSTAFVLV
jgi:hypothetical protein